MLPAGVIPSNFLPKSSLNVGHWLIVQCSILGADDERAFLWIKGEILHRKSTRPVTPITPTNQLWA